MRTYQTTTESPTETLSRDAGRYLLEVYFVSLKTNERVQTGTLGERLDVNPASVTEMLSNLAAAGLLDYEKHYGATLTMRGETLAEALVWRYCVTEQFFTDVLVEPIDRKTAYQIGFELPENGLRRLARLVDIPCMRACSQLEQGTQQASLSPSDV